MWLFFAGGFVSIVQDKSSAERLLVRARKRQDLANFLKGLRAPTRASCRIQETPEADYRFRVRVPKEVAAERIRQIVSEIDYPNFKARIHGEPDRDSAYMKIWAILAQFQES